MSKRIITVRSGNEEIQMEITEEKYRNYYRPWWQQKKWEQRNREAMEENGYAEESFEAWSDGGTNASGILDSSIGDINEIVEKKLLLRVLEEALKSLMPEEWDLALLAWGGEMSLAEFSEMKGKNARTISDNKRKVLEKLRSFFERRGYEVRKRN